MVRIMRHGRLLCVVSLLCAMHAGAQMAPKTPVVTLDYHKAQTYAIGRKSSGLIADFQCGSDGSLFLLMTEDMADAHELPALNRLTPAGDIVRFSYDAAGPANGFRFINPPSRYFVSESTVATLNWAQRADPSNPSRADPAKSTRAPHLVMTYDYDGTLKKIAALEPGINPSTIAAFPSGDFLIAYSDKVRKQPHFLVLDADGDEKGELRIDMDQYHGADPATKSKGPAHRDYVARVMTALRFVPYGDDLLLVSPQASFPLLEISEHGLVRPIALQLPLGKTIASVLPSNGRTILVNPGHSEGDLYAQPLDDYDKQKPYFLDDEILEFNGSDGTLLRSIEIAHDLHPACNSNNEFYFLRPRPEDGRLEVVKGTLSY